MVTYPDLLALFARVAGLRRRPVLVPGIPRWVVPRGCAGISGLPLGEVSALVDSLAHQMVCREDLVRTELLDDGFRFTSVEEALRCSLTPRAEPGTSSLGDVQAAAMTDPD